MIRRLTTAVLAGLIWPIVVCGAPPKVEGPASVAEHKIVRLKAESDAAEPVYDWEVTPLDTADTEVLAGGRFAFTAPPGKYVVTLRVFDAKSKAVEKVRHAVEIIGGPVAPADPLAAAVAAAWAKETGASRAVHARLLAAVYRQGVAGIDAAGGTVEDFAALVRAAANDKELGLPADALPHVRKALGEAIQAELGGDLKRPLADVKDKVKGVYGRAAAALAGLGER